MRFAKPCIALLALPLVVTSASMPATIYLSPGPHRDLKTPLPSLSPLEANSVLSNFLGLRRSIWSEVFEQAVETGKETWGHLMNVAHPREEMIGAGSPNVLLLLLPSDHPQDFLPSEYQPSFSIPAPPPVPTFTDLLDTYTSQAHAIFDRVIFSIAHVSSSKSLLDVFDMTVSESSSIFMDELRTLTQLVENPSQEGDEFTALQLNGLEKIEEEHGRQSEVYQTAALSMQAILSHKNLKSQKFALVVVPSTTISLAGRSAPLSEQVNSPRAAQPVFSVAQCFTDAATCGNATNACSGRGECVVTRRASKTCYSCSCSVTMNDKGIPQSWAGAMCEKKDISVPFALLTASTIILVLLVLGSISILYSIGNVELPSTLTGASTGHLKHE